eukprot:5361095-Amphidinium_carterae.1
MVVGWCGVVGVRSGRGWVCREGFCFWTPAAIALSLAFPMDSVRFARPWHVKAVVALLSKHPSEAVSSW